MARLQILELPEGAGDARPPFVLVVDQYVPQRYIIGPDQPEPIDQFQGIAEQIGARAVLVFEEKIDIPANDVPAGPHAHPDVVHFEGNSEQWRDWMQEELRKQGEQGRLGSQ